MNPHPPLIGITTYGRDEEGRFGLPAVYVDAVRRAGGIPILIPPGEPNLAQLLAHLDGVILAGGGDLDPDLYEGANHEAVYMVDPERDSSEIALVRWVVEAGTPTLGICRGAQVVNVALGGSLIEHLPDEVGDAVVHRLPISEASSHAVELQADSRLEQILNQSEVTIASWHHQALRRVAPPLHIVARAADGTVEAVEMADHPWLIAVQWHPEMTAADDPIQQRIFDAFVQVAAVHRHNPAPA